MTTGPHAHAMGHGDDAVSKTAVFMQKDLAALESRTGHPPSQSDVIDTYRKWDDYKDARTMKRVKTLAWAIGVIGTAVFGVWVMFGGEGIKPEDVKDAVDEVAPVITEQVDKNSRKIEVLKDLHYDSLEVQIQKGTQSDLKLDIIAEKLGVKEEVEAVPEGQAVLDAKEEVAAHKELVEGAKKKPKGDPFAGIDDKKAK